MISLAIDIIQVCSLVPIPGIGCVLDGRTLQSRGRGKTTAGAAQGSKVQSNGTVKASTDRLGFAKEGREGRHTSDDDGGVYLDDAGIIEAVRA